MAALPGLILLVEDNLELRETLEELLFDEGCRVVGTADGLAALEYLSRGERPALVLLDFFMPRMNGWDFLERLAADPALDGMPVVAMSGSLVAHPLVVATLRKPFDFTELIELVHRFLRGP